MKKKIFAIVTVVLFLSAVCVTVVAVSTKEPAKKECCKEAHKCDKKEGQGCGKDAQGDKKEGAGCCKDKKEGQGCGKDAQGDKKEGAGCCKEAQKCDPKACEK